MVVSAERINSLEVTLSLFGSHFGGDASFRVAVSENVDFCKSVGCNLLTTQGLSGRIYRSLVPLVHRVFLFQNFNVILVPIVWLCSVLHAKSWIS